MDEQDHVVCPATAFPREAVSGFHEGDIYDVWERGQWWTCILTCDVSGWYFITEDGLQRWPLISLWRWRALSYGTHAEGAISGVIGGLWIVGTASPGAMETVEQLVVEEHALLIDIRYAARSQWFPQWNKGRLLARFGVRYTHERGLANANYKDHSLPIKLVDPDRAVAGAAGLVIKGFGLVLLCACRGDDEACHCRLVASMIMEQVKEARRAASPLRFFRRKK
jgi:hypothetical protein